MEEQRANEWRDGGTDGEREGPDGVSLTPWQRTRAILGYLIPGVIR